MSATTLPAHTDPMVDFQATHEPHDAQPDDRQSHSASIELNSSYMNHSFNLNNSFAICDPIDLVWQDVTVKAGQTVLLNNVSGHISEGLISIMGPSGSGKTTLLNCLACRLDANVTVEGSLRINGEPYTTSTLKKFLGYVMQDDVHNPLLTPRETLRFVAEARLRHKMSDAECHKMVDDALHTLSLTHCADTLIGQGNSGISGGEKKRLSVAIELLSQPKMLFLDEPTSNLDSLDALHFIEAMRNLVTETHCVIVCTIHQPQFKVFSLFERLLMLRSGETVYDGPISDVSQFCADAGKPCPPLANPADHMMDVIAPVTNDSFDTEKRKREEFAALYGHRNVNLDTGIGRNNLTYLREGAPFVGMLRMSFHRSLVLISRRRNEFIINFFITAINAVLIGLVFFRVGTGSASNNVRLPALFFAVVNQATFGAVSTVNLIPNERSSILRDRASGHVSALSFFIGKVSAEMLSKLPFPIIFSIISYFLIGFQEEGNHFFRFLAILCMANWTGIAVALAASAIAKDAHTAALALPLFMELSRLFGGYFIPLAQLPAGLRWINYGSYLFYAFNGVSQNEFSDLVLDCAPTCSDGYGINVLNTRGQYLSYADSMGILTCYWAICLVAAYLAVRFRK